MAEAIFKKPKENQRFCMGRPGRSPWCTRGAQFSFLFQLRGTIDFLRFYKGFRLTVRFCRRRRGPNGVHSGVAEAIFKKPKENQRFCMGRPGRSPWCTRGVQSSSLFQLRATIDFLRFYKGLRLTVRFPGGRFFWPRRKCTFFH